MAHQFLHALGAEALVDQPRCEPMAKAVDAAKIGAQGVVRNGPPSAASWKYQLAAARARELPFLQRVLAEGRHGYVGRRAGALHWPDAPAVIGALAHCKRRRENPSPIAAGLSGHGGAKVRRQAKPFGP